MSSDFRTTVTHEKTWSAWQGMHVTIGSLLAVGYVSHATHTWIMPHIYESCHTCDSMYIFHSSMWLDFQMTATHENDWTLDSRLRDSCHTYDSMCMFLCITWLRLSDDCCTWEWLDSRQSGHVSHGTHAIHMALGECFIAICNITLFILISNMTLGGHTTPHIWLIVCDSFHMTHSVSLLLYDSFSRVTWLILYDSFSISHTHVWHDSKMKMSVWNCGWVCGVADVVPSLHG